MCPFQEDSNPFLIDHLPTPGDVPTIYSGQAMSILGCTEAETTTMISQVTQVTNHVSSASYACRPTLNFHRSSHHMPRKTHPVDPFNAEDSNLTFDDCREGT